MDVRSSKLQQEYVMKARAADRIAGVGVGEVGRVEGGGEGDSHGLPEENFEHTPTNCRTRGIKSPDSQGI